MDYFEGIIKTLLEHDGYWVRQSFKVNLTKQEKRDIGKHSIPRPEIDILAFKPKENIVLVLEAKSFLDSPGVDVEKLKEKYEIPTGRYKLFTCAKYRKIVFSRLKKDLRASGMADGKTKLILGLAAGNVYKSKSDEIKKLFNKNKWFFLSPEEIKEKVSALALKGYENEPAVITAKILNR